MRTVPPLTTAAARNGTAFVRSGSTSQCRAATAPPRTCQRLGTEINRLGGDCTETPDGLVITATPLGPGTWRAYADHRMAMAGAIVGLRVAGAQVDDIGATSKTLPEFPQLWARMLEPNV